MIERKNKTGLIIGILLLVIAVLLIIMVYAFAVKPAITGNIIKAQNEGYEYAFIQIAQQAITCQPVPLRIGNQTINMVAVECLPQECLQQAQLQ